MLKKAAKILLACSIFISAIFSSCTLTGEGTFTLSGEDQLPIGAFSYVEIQNAEASSVTWTSSNSKVVSVNSVGRIKALSAGTATITAASSKVKKTHTVNVISGNMITSAKKVDGYYGGGGTLTGSLEEGFTLNVEGPVHGQWMNRFYLVTNASVGKGDHWICRGKIDCDIDINADENTATPGVTIKFDDSAQMLYDPYVSVKAGETKYFEYEGDSDKSAMNVKFVFDFAQCDSACTIKVYDLELWVTSTTDDNGEPEKIDISGSSEKVTVGKDGTVSKTVTDGVECTTYIADDDDFTTLVWSDEFNGSSLDMKNWTYETGGTGWGNGEVQTYTTQNVTVTNGLMIITADANNNSSRIFTREKKLFQYGKIVARMKIEQGAGSWPAFWMMGSGSNYSWPYCGEIDIFEDVNNLPISYSTIHWNKYGPDPATTYDHQAFGEDTQKNSCEGNIGNINTNEWHEYALIWTKDMLQFTFDDHLITQIEIKPENGMGCFQTPFYIIFNYAMGGEWPWNWDPSTFTNIPWHLYVDWVRVYQ